MLATLSSSDFCSGDSRRNSIMMLRSIDHRNRFPIDEPLGCVKSPFSTPERKALLNCESNVAGMPMALAWLAWMYFLSA